MTSEKDELSPSTRVTFCLHFPLSGALLSAARFVSEWKCARHSDRRGQRSAVIVIPKMPPEKQHCHCVLVCLSRRHEETEPYLLCEMVQPHVQKIKVEVKYYTLESECTHLCVYLN